MDIRFFLDSVSEKLTFSNVSTNLSAYIYNDFEHLPRWKDVDIALIGVHEQRGSNNNNSQKNPADSIREALYKLKKGRNCRIVDLGNLRIGENLEQTYGRLQEVCEMLLNQNVVPIILGGSNDLAIGQYKAYENMEKLIYVLSVDNKINIEQNQEYISEDYLSHILLHQPNYLFACGILAYQNFLNVSENLKIFEKLNFDELSLGTMRNNNHQIEPLVRTADMLAFDISAIRKNDAFANNNASFFGLSGEEACQIAWYSGLSENLSSFGIYEYNADLDDGTTAHIIAVMIWYFLEGFSYRKQHPNFVDSFYTKYLVNCVGYDLIFYKASFTEKWWLEVPKSDILKHQARIACSYQDYQDACNGHIPERLLKALNMIF